MASEIAPNGNLIAIDPGAACAWALFGRWMLSMVGKGFDTIPTMPMPQYGLSGPFAVLVERPVMRTGKGAVPPNDVIKLATRAGMLAGVAMSRGYGGVGDCFAVAPHEWKGQLSKPISRQRILAKLPQAMGYVPGNGDLSKRWTSDEWDAVGIGLWGLGLDPNGTRTIPRRESLW